jgi:drug/metabolite transporter (DMT)-like permease
MTQQQQAYAYALAAVLIWSTVASAFKISLRYMSPIQLLLWADFFSLGCLFGVLVAQNKIRLLKTLPRYALMRCLLLGGLNPFLYYVVLFAAYDLLPAQEAQPLNYTWAITLSVLSWPLLGQRLGFQKVVAIAVSYTGVLVISSHGNPFALRFSNGLGVALALGSTIIWALFWIFNAMDKTDPVVSLFLNGAAGFPLILAVCLIFSSPWPGTWQGLAGSAYVGVFEMGITFVFWLKALRLTSSTANVSTLIFFSPFLSLIFIHFLVGEEILTSTIVGLGFIIAGNALQHTGSKAD